jgi:hypothetical protein
MHGLEEAGTGKMRQATGIVPIGLVRRQRLERLVGLPALDAHDGHAVLDQAVVQHGRHPAGLEYHPPTSRCLR